MKFCRAESSEKGRLGDTSVIVDMSQAQWIICRVCRQKYPGMPSEQYQGNIVVHRRRRSSAVGARDCVRCPGRLPQIMVLVEHRLGKDLKHYCSLQPSFSLCCLDLIEKVCIVDIKWNFGVVTLWSNVYHVIYNVIAHNAVNFEKWFDLWSRVFFYVIHESHKPNIYYANLWQPRRCHDLNLSR